MPKTEWLNRNIIYKGRSRVSGAYKYSLFLDDMTIASFTAFTDTKREADCMARSQLERENRGIRENNLAR